MVTIESPVVRPERPDVAAEPPATPPLRILAVDDDLEVRATLVELLTSDGHRVVAVEAGVAALVMLSWELFDLVITDLGMPDLCGYEVAEAVRLRWPSLSIIVTTGWREQVDSARLAAAGVQVVLGKPFRLHGIRAALASALAQRPPAIPAGGRVLVVDRDARLSRLLARLLATAGYAVVEAHGVAEALERLAQALATGKPFDILLSDAALAAIDGWTLTVAARARQPGLVVGLVSGAPVAKDEAKRHGVDIIVSKPYRLDEILAALARAMALRRSRCTEG